MGQQAIMICQWYSCQPICDDVGYVSGAKVILTCRQLIEGFDVNCIRLMKVFNFVFWISNWNSFGRYKSSKVQSRSYQVGEVGVVLLEYLKKYRKKMEWRLVSLFRYGVFYSMFIWYWLSFLILLLIRVIFDVLLC